MHMYMHIYMQKNLFDIHTTIHTCVYEIRMKCIRTCVYVLYFIRISYTHVSMDGNSVIYMHIHMHMHTYICICSQINI